MVRIVSLALLVLTRLPAIAEIPAPILRSLPPAVQKEIEEMRAMGGWRCGDGRTCIHGVNCAIGYAHQVEIYVRRGNVWRKSFSVQATEPTFLSVEPSENPNFRALVLSVGAGDTVLGCPIRNKNDPTAWKHGKCDFVVKWDGTKFSHKPL
jgi:hypothetical protein